SRAPNQAANSSSSASRFATCSIGKLLSCRICIAASLCTIQHTLALDRLDRAANRQRVLGRVRRNDTRQILRRDNAALHAQAQGAAHAPKELLIQRQSVNVK